METSWLLTDICPGGSKVVGGGYTEKGKLEQKSILMRKSRYLFYILDLGGDGVCCNTGPKGSFKVFLDSALEVEGGKFDYSDFGYFGDDCPDTTSKPTNVVCVVLVYSYLRSIQEPILPFLLVLQLTASPANIVSIIF